MDLLEYGMKNQNSSNAVKKRTARGALRFVKWQADLYERRLEKREIWIPEKPEETENMLKRIYAALAGQTTQ